MSATMMKCGHAANARNTATGQPSCMICIGIHPGAEVVDDAPASLEGRTARCTQCRKERPSSAGLPFFEYRGPGGVDHMCRHCPYSSVAHERKRAGERVVSQVCDTFEPRSEGYPTDNFYCGCRGWD